MTETDIQRDILAALARVPGLVCWRSSTGVSRSGGRFLRYGVKGQGDITGLLPGGRMFALEVKTPTGRVSPEQVEFGARVNGAGGLWAVVRSVDEALAVIEAALPDMRHGDDGNGGHG